MLQGLIYISQALQHNFQALQTLHSAFRKLQKRIMKSIFCTYIFTIGISDNSQSVIRFGLKEAESHKEIQTGTTVPVGLKKYVFCILIAKVF